MEEEAIGSLIELFKANAHHTEEGIEFWYARDLQKLLEYGEWRFFKKPLERAITACVESGNDASDHFVQSHGMVLIGSGAKREIEDYMLSRYACYLIAQNADARKKPVAFAQTYFAIQTRRQELRDKEERNLPMSEDEKRVYLSRQIKEHNKYLSSAAKNAGVITPLEFAIFHSKGYQGLYGKKDDKFSQLFRDIKSHRTSKTNPIYNGYAKSVDGGLKITQKGVDFVKKEFDGYF